MKHLLTYNLFESNSNDDVLMIFDFDDTLADSPRFEELAINYLKEGLTIKDLVNRSLNQIGKSKEDVRFENGRIYIDDPNLEIVIKGNWVRKKGRVYLVAPDKFYYLEDSFPDKLTPLAKKYNESKNKAIVTARIKDLRGLLVKYLNKLGLDYPNHGLFMFPADYEDGSRVASWKSKTIVNLIKDTGFKKVEFFDDKSKTVNAVVKAVKLELPDVDIIGHKVKSPEMTYLNEELLISYEDRRDFLKEIEDVFIDEIVDVFDIEQCPPELDEEEETLGIFYDFNDFYLALDKENPYLEILIWCGYEYFDKFEGMEKSLNNFIERVRNMGYECNQKMSIKDYLYDREVNFHEDPFEIEVYYK